MTHITKPDQMENTRVISELSCGLQGPLITRDDDSSDDDLDLDQDVVKYYPWANAMDADMDENETEEAQGKTITGSLTDLQMFLLSALALATVSLQWEAGVFQNAANYFVIEPTCRDIFLPLFCTNKVTWDAV
jgi:hypothetical protein